MLDRVNSLQYGQHQRPKRLADINLNYVIKFLVILKPTHHPPHFPTMPTPTFFLHPPSNVYILLATPLPFSPPPTPSLTTTLSHLFTAFKTCQNVNFLPSVSSQKPCVHRELNQFNVPRRWRDKNGDRNTRRWKGSRLGLAVRR